MERVFRACWSVYFIFFQLHSYSSTTWYPKHLRYIVVSKVLALRSIIRLQPFSVVRLDFIEVTKMPVPVAAVELIDPIQFRY